MAGGLISMGRNRIGPQHMIKSVSVAAIGGPLMAIALWATVLLSPISTLGESATPTPDVPPASLCRVEAPSFDELNAIVATPLAEASPVVTRTPGVVPEGTPADETTTVEIVATVRELVGCFNAGEPLRSYGLYTAPYLNRLFNRQGGFPRGVYDSLATPEPTDDPSTHTEILEITDIRILGEGIAGANVTMRYSSIPMPKHFYFSFEWNGERWLISGILGEISFSVP